MSNKERDPTFEEMMEELRPYMPKPQPLPEPKRTTWVRGDGPIIIPQPKSDFTGRDQ